MECCTVCAHKLQEVINKILIKGKHGNCNSCNSENVMTIELKDVSEEVGNFVVEYWSQLSTDIKFLNRYFLTNQFVELFKNTLSKGVRILPKNTVLYRARLSGLTSNFYIPNKPFPPEQMGAPPLFQTAIGRVNPKGMKYLYTADNIETAIAEVRPWKSSKISVARVITNFDLLMYDLAEIPYMPLVTDNSFECSIHDLIDFLIMNILSAEISRPVSSLEYSELEYIPTQLFTEYIKSEGFYGIIYKSSLGNGRNITIFNEKNTTIIDSQLYEVENIGYQIKEFEG